MRSSLQYSLIGIYSFFPTKTLCAYGDAGLMVTNDEEAYKKIKSYRVHGSSVKYHHDYVGYNSRLDTMQAAILRVKLRKTNEAIAARARIAARYTERLADVPGLRIPGVRSDAKPVSYVYNILVPKRDELAAYLKDKGIGTSIYYPKPLHLQKCFSYLGYKEGDFPVAEEVAGQILALPIFPKLTDEEVDYVCDAVADPINRTNHGEYRDTERCLPGRRIPKARVSQDFGTERREYRRQRHGGMRSHFR